VRRGGSAFGDKIPKVRGAADAPHVGSRLHDPRPRPADDAVGRQSPTRVSSRRARKVSRAARFWTSRRTDDRAALRRLESCSRDPAGDSSTAATRWLVIEHKLEVISRKMVVRSGAEGGEEGGELVASAHPRHVAQVTRPYPARSCGPSSSRARPSVAQSPREARAHQGTVVLVIGAACLAVLIEGMGAAG